MAPGAPAHPYDLLAELLEYPGPDVFARAVSARAALAARSPEAAAAIEAFASDIAPLDPAEVEELFTRTFDILAPCCLDVGYQLFGETYKRGLFLVKLRQETRSHGIETGPELPDHLPVVLRLLARLEPTDDPRGLAVEAILPALGKMRATFGDGTNPYAALLAAVDAVLRADFSIAEEPRVRSPSVHLPILSDGGLEP
jgi:nitrate reductase delta subunit